MLFRFLLLLFRRWSWHSLDSLSLKHLEPGTRHWILLVPLGWCIEIWNGSVFCFLLCLLLSTPNGFVRSIGRGVILSYAVLFSTRKVRSIGRGIHSFWRIILDSKGSLNRAGSNLSLITLDSEECDWFIIQMRNVRVGEYPWKYIYLSFLDVVWGASKPGREVFGVLPSWMFFSSIKH